MSRGRHRPECDCGVCKLDRAKNLKALEKREAKNIKDLGWYCHMVMSDDDQTPTGVNYHTHGCQESFGHMDFQVVAHIPPELAHHLFYISIELVKNGTKIGNKDRLAGVLENLDVSFVEAQECGRTVLRIILPDKTGCLDQGKMEAPFSEQWDKINPSPEFTSPSLN